MVTRNLWEKLEEIALEYPDKVAISCKKDNIWAYTTYKELRSDIKSLSEFLIKEGIRKDDKVALLLNNRTEWSVIFFSTVSVGAVSVPIDPEATEDEIESILRNSESKIVFAGKSSSGVIEKILPRCPFVEKVIYADTEEFEEIVSTYEVLPATKVEVKPSDPACILYTSGTTAQPKGVTLSHKNLRANCTSLNNLHLITNNDSILSVLPLHHAYSLTVTMILPLLYGGMIAYPGTLRGEEVLRSMREINPTVFTAVPQIFNAFNQKISDNDFMSLLSSL